MRRYKVILGCVSLPLAFIGGIIAFLSFSAVVSDAEPTALFFEYGLLAAIIALTLGPTGLFLLLKHASPTSRMAKAWIASAWILASVAAAIGVPSFIHARNTSASNACTNNLRQIDGAKQQWALEHKATADSRPTWNDLLPYLGRGSRGEMLKCPQGGTYTLESVGEVPRCSIGGPGHELR